VSLGLCYSSSQGSRSRSRFLCLGSCAIETLLSFDQPDLARANQGVQAKVFSDLLDTPLDVEECPISETLHQLI